MKGNVRTQMVKKVLAVAMALMVGVTFMPMFSGSAFAAEDPAGPADEELLLDDGIDVDLDDVVIEGEEEAIVDGEEPAPEAVETEENLPVDDLMGGPLGAAKTLTVTQTDYASGLFTVTGPKLSGDTYKELYVSSFTSSGSVKTTFLMTVTKAATLNLQIDMKQYLNVFSVGPHSIIALTTKGEQIQGDNIVGTFVYSKPGNRASLWEMYSKYFFYTGSNYYLYQGNDRCDLYMDYKVKGGKWKGPYEVPGYGTSFTGLKPNKTYYFRTYYGAIITATDGQKYLFSSKDIGKASKAVKVKTGLKKLPIKSVKVKAIKVKKHKKRVWVDYGGGVYGWETAKWWTYKIKVTVKMKKKPGVKGIYINGKQAKGNKKKYTKTFGTYSNYSKPRGKKFTVKMYSFKNRKYKGYSPIQTRTKKVK